MIGVHLTFESLAAENAETYRTHDAALWAEIQDALSAIAEGLPRARQTALRILGGTAWSVAVPVHGRDEVYQVIWAQPPGADDTAHIVHLGQALS
ncbi:hypothetical protein ASE15_03295 [Oerskovia sp. Root22]|nr:hypothetical protein ASE15_03295 [Oerskovia sp. Root22]